MSDRLVLVGATVALNSVQVPVNAKSGRPTLPTQAISPVSLQASERNGLCAALHRRFITVRCGLVRRHDCAVHLSRRSIKTSAIALVKGRIGSRHVGVSV
jgi:hypothetical protein